ncbi:phosphate ABC transporter permease subunit PstC [Caldilinea sp.]|uniref:phosphate ABC transporter permease subunit PstC n=1 Tax=Caldilinea sp. TaxID=2293560 RepID=UPI001B09FA6E|nr:phosphate ABC transporter permease subunit PstC [Caldilinea sp.]MBO9391559.1 phosphate ABC transporter permease subunit PstC [Caldilinea sp.]
MAVTKLAPQGIERGSLSASKRRRAAGESAIQMVLFLCAVVSIGTTLGIIYVLLQETVLFFQQVSPLEFFGDTRWTPLFASKRFGVWPLVVGTVLVAAGAMVVALPLGLLAAIYLSEYASDRMRRTLKPVLEILAGIPTVVYGYFALTFVTPLLKQIFPQTQTFNALSASIVMGIMILPTVASISEDALSAVPRSLREAAFGLGATRFEVATRIVVPAALSGISAAFILAISRAIGETMIVAIAAGQQPKITLNPLESIETMTAYIVQVSLGDTPHQSLAYKTIFAVGMLLFVMTFGLNLVSHWITRRFREVYE